MNCGNWPLTFGQGCHYLSRRNLIGSGYLHYQYNIYLSIASMLRQLDKSNVQDYFDVYVGLSFMGLGCCAFTNVDWF